MTEPLDVKAIITKRVDPRLHRWADYMEQMKGYGIGYARVSAAYAERGSGGEAGLDLPAAFVEEAVSTNDAVNELPADEAAAVRAEFLEIGSVLSKAHYSCHCSIATYYRRLNAGRERLYRLWFGGVCITLK